jgi:CRISPR-associated protein Csm1
MSVQIFLEGKLLGIEEFLFAPAGDYPDQVFLGRSHWISLLSEVLPRALLSELGLARILLGSSGGGQFLLLLPEESRTAADRFLEAAAGDIGRLSAGALKLLWSVTENLGDWSDVRRRLQETMDRKRGAPLAGTPWEVPEFDPAPAHQYFVDLAAKLRDAESVGWSPDTPGRPLIGEGRHTFALTASSEAIPLARTAALSEDGFHPASTAELAERASGLQTWGVLRGDADNFGIRIRRAQSIEEHIQLSVLYKQFFAGEMEVICSMPEYWRKVTVIYSGGDDFAVYGAWDALLGLAGEMERLFHRFAQQNLADFPGAEGKTISMALALAPAADASLGAVFEEAGRRLESAKSSDKDCIWLLGRTLEWKQFAEAGALRDSLMKMIAQFGCSPQYLRDLCGIYRESQSRLSRRQARRSGGERPWRYHRRIRRILSGPGAPSAPGGAAHSLNWPGKAELAAPFSPRQPRGDFQKARAALIADLIGRSAVTVKLRPAGRVALEWARLSAEEAPPPMT